MKNARHDIRLDPDGYPVLQHIENPLFQKCDQTADNIQCHEHRKHGFQHRGIRIGIRQERVVHPVADTRQKQTESGHKCGGDHKIRRIIDGHVLQRIPNEGPDDGL